MPSRAFSRKSSPRPPRSRRGQRPSRHRGKFVVVFLILISLTGWLWFTDQLPPFHLPTDWLATQRSPVVSPVSPVAPLELPAALPSAPSRISTPVPAAAIPRVQLVLPPRAEVFPRPAVTWLEAQVALAQRRFSPGPIDGIGGAQTVAALRAFQANLGLPSSGRLDAATREHLTLSAAPLTQLQLSADDVARLLPLDPTWLGKSNQAALAHETILEQIAERTHAHPGLIERLNPAVNWSQVAPGSVFIVPAVDPTEPRAAASRLRVSLAARTLQALDADGVILAHFPVSIARMVEKRPLGELRVTVVVPDPNYTFDPATFPESPEAQALGRKLILPPGPNNPVGVAWIGLDRPGYGIHGTPKPEQVGRTESHGCFRLANWDARTLLEFAWVGLPVSVEP
jgi:lipoprotein-anchoring transpeptidase ErfK/SrfK